MYDLTSLLTTIAACSATIVAIIGGFIASKLISIGTERNEVISKLDEIGKEIFFRKNEIDAAQHELDEDDALDFIIEHIDELINRDRLDDVYKEENQPRISKKALYIYWEKASYICKNVANFYTSQGDNLDYRLNDDEIPVPLTELLDGDFEYDICKEIIENLSKSNYTNSVLGGFCIPNINTPRITGAWYFKAKEKISENNSAIKWLEIQQQNSTLRKNSLYKPKGMIGGIVAFSLFSMINIVLPMLATPFSTEDYKLFLLTKFCFIAMFAIGLLMMMWYLINLLRWKDNH